MKTWEPEKQCTFHSKKRSLAKMARQRDWKDADRKPEVALKLLNMSYLSKHRFPSHGRFPFFSGQAGRMRGMPECEWRSVSATPVLQTLRGGRHVPGYSPPEWGYLAGEAARCASG
jgi:hypothetical protein